MADADTTDALAAFRMDVARWIVPESIGDPAQATLRTTIPLLIRNDGLRVMAMFRLGSHLAAKGIPGMALVFKRLIQRRYGLEINIGTPIGGGLYIAHPIGSVLAVAEMGENCSVIANVICGMRNEYAFPVLGDEVFLGAGARVLGGITLNNGARVGANAVVLHDVADGQAVVGIPARPIGTPTTES